MTTPAAPEPRDMRAADADRERVANVLREAAGDGRLSMDELDERLDAVYAAKTYAELEPITRDLPGSGAATAPAPSAAPSPVPAGDPARFGGVAGSQREVAVLSGIDRRGDWTVPKDFTAVLVLGGAQIDMREARFAGREVTINVVAILSGCEIIVPADATVHINGVGILGAFDNAGGSGGSPDGPVITIEGVAFLSGVSVQRKPTLDASRRARQRRLDARDEYRQIRRDYRERRRDARRNGELE